MRQHYDANRERCSSAHGGRYCGRITADGGDPTRVRPGPVGWGRGAVPDGRGVCVSRARDDGAPVDRAGGHRGSHAAAVGRLPDQRRRDGTRATAQEQARRDERTVLVPPR